MPLYENLQILPHDTIGTNSANYFATGFFAPIFKKWTLDQAIPYVSVTQFMHGTLIIE